jgi:hypothetical protein
MAANPLVAFAGASATAMVSDALYDKLFGGRGRKTGGTQTASSSASDAGSHLPAGTTTPVAVAAGGALPRTTSPGGAPGPDRDSPSFDGLEHGRR